MQKLPHLTFTIDFKKDIEAFFDLASEAKYDNGRTLEWAFFSRYPELRRHFEGIRFIGEKDTIENFIRTLYEKDASLMKKWEGCVEGLWNQEKELFYQKTREIFEEQWWPEGAYIAYPTIWTMYPRYLENTTFLLPYKKEDFPQLLSVIAHEMLHFIFYKYFFSRHPELKTDENGGIFVWHISEAFNTFVQNLPQWPDSMNDPTAGYPEHDTIVSELREKYKEVSQENVDNLIEDIMHMVRERK
jgi:hypothetical protein